MYNYFIEQIVGQTGRFNFRMEIINLNLLSSS